MLIVLEGLDGAGKSTQFALLKEYLQGRFPLFRHIHYPRYDSPVYGNLISRFLRGEFGSIESVHPQLVALLYAEDRHGAVPQMKSVLENGGVLLLDRYVYSNIAYQCAKLTDPVKQEELREWIFDTEYNEFGLPRPDLNIFLNVPIGFVKKSLSPGRQGDDRGYLDGGRDIHEANIEFQKRVRDMYLSQAKLDRSFVVIECADRDGSMLPAACIFDKIKAVIDENF